MNFTNREKELLLSNAPVLSRITLYTEDGTALQVFNEDDYLVDWEYEDYRYVPDQGFIGQFVERLLDGHLMNIPEGLSLEDKEISVEIAVYDSTLQEQVYHNYGRFIITKIEKEDTTGSYKFESSDYTKKFNEVYTGGVTFPCTALKLLNSACDQVGVELDTSNNAQAVDYIVSVDGLQAGNYAFLINGTYYNFTLNEDLTNGNLLMLKGDKLILRKVTSDYNIIREEIPYSTSETSSNTVLSDEPYDYYALINDDFIVNDNQFTENNTCRDVVRSVAQLSYTWARINENNKLCLDFVKNDDIDSYDEIDTDKYYEATVTGDKVEPINKVLIGMSQVEGENIVKEQDNDLLGVDTIYGETSQETYSGKNLIPFPYDEGGGNKNTTKNGLTFVVDDDGVVTINGTATAGTAFYLVNNNNNVRTNLLNKQLILSGCPSNGSSSTYRLQIWNNTNTNNSFVYDYGNGTTFTFSNTNLSYNIVIWVSNGATLDNVVFKPMIRLSSISDNTYEKYAGGKQSPSVECPQNIKTVRGNNELKIIGNNIFNPSYFISKNNVSITNDGEISSAGMTSTLWTYDNAQYYTHLKQGNYTLSVFFSTIDTNQYSRMRIMKTDNTILDNTETFKNKTKLVYHLNLNSDTDVGIMFKLDNGVCTFQITEGVEETEYKPYEEVVKSIDLPVENYAVNAESFSTYTDFESYATLTDEYYNNCRIRNANFTDLPTSNYYTVALYKNISNSWNIDFNPGDYITFSFWIKGTTNGHHVLTYFYGPSGCASARVVTSTGVGAITTWGDGWCNFAPIITQDWQRVYVTYQINPKSTKENIAKDKHLLIRAYGGVNIDICGVQIEKSETPNAFTPYYYEENLFDKDNTNVINGYINSAGTITSDAYNRTIYIPCKPNTTYTISKIISQRFRVGTYSSTPQINSTTSNYGGNFTDASITITSGVYDNYLAVWLYNGGLDTLTYEQIIDTLQIKEHIKAIELSKTSSNYMDYIRHNTGKNICDINAIMPSMISSIGVQTPFSYDSNTGTLTITNNSNDTYLPAIWNNASYIQGINIPVKPNTTYTFSFDVDRPLSELNNSVMALNEETNKYEYLSGGLLHTNVFTVNSGNHTQMTFRIGSTASTGTVTNFSNFQIEENNTRTYFEPHGNDEWFICRKNRKLRLPISGMNNSDNYPGWQNQTQVKKDYRNVNSWLFPLGITYYSNICTQVEQQQDYIGFNTAGNGVVFLNKNVFGSLYTETYLKENYPSLIFELLYNLKIFEYEKITYQPLIDQLNELKDTPLFEGTNYITVDTLNEKPSLDITVTDLEQDSTSYSGKSFEITGHDYDKGGSIYIYDNPLTYTEELRRIAINGAENLFGLTYTPMEVQSIGHPWLTGKEFVKVTNLENQELYFYPFDRKISYSGILTTDLSAQAKNEVAQKYENRNNVVDKINHTEISVNKANGTIEALSRTVNENKEEFTQWQSTEYNSLKSTVGEIDRDLNVGNDSIHSRLSSVEQTTTAITNMFQITGGINVIRNSAFLLQDNVWEFTDSGTNPYHTPLGASYNSTLSGQTVSVAEIKARSTKIKSKSENITNLILNTKYTFNFYHKQDNNMTTTIKMYSTENNSSKAFNDIVITGQQEFKNYEVSFTPTTYTNYTIEIIVTSTASVGYAYLYDMMLNSGDKQAWQPASDEIYSTTLQMSRLGLKVYSVGDGTITLLGSDGMSTWETSDGVTLGRLVSMRTEAGDRVKTVTSEALYLTKDIREENANRWVETIVTISGTPYKVEYIESGGQ